MTFQMFDDDDFYDTFDPADWFPWPTCPGCGTTLNEVNVIRRLADEDGEQYEQLVCVDCLVRGVDFVD